MHKYLGSCLVAAKKKISWLMKIESDPFTLNNHYMWDYKEKFLTYYRRVRQDARTKCGVFSEGNEPEYEDSFSVRLNTGLVNRKKSVPAEALSLLVRLGYQVKTQQDLDRLLRQDTMEPALAVMSSARAYFQGMFSNSDDILPAKIHVPSGLQAFCRSYSDGYRL